MSDDTERTYTAEQVAKKFNVTTRTVSRWADAGKLGYFRTIGNHRRYNAAAIDQIIRDRSKP